MVITWTNYLTASAVVMGIYYAGVTVLYFRREINLHAKLAKDKPSQDKNTPPPSQGSLFHEQISSQATRLDVASAAPMHSLVDELQAYIHQAGKHGSQKSELHSSLIQILQKYPTIKGSIFQEGISNMIAVTVEHNCAVHFSAEDLSSLWKI